MNIVLQRQRWWWLALIFFFGVHGKASAEWEEVVEEPRLLRLKLYDVNTQVEVEGQMEKRTIKGESTKRNYLSIEPTLGLGVHGSVYHSNLLEFNVATQDGLSWQQVTLDPPGGTNESTGFLQRYHASGNLLREKPCATSLFADKDLTYRDFDFFNRARVDSQRYGGNTGYAAGPVPFSLSALHLQENVTSGLLRNTSLDESTLTFNAQNERAKTGQTEFTYVLDQFHRREEDISTISGVSNTADLFDTETWGADDWIKLRSMAFYHQLDDTTVGTRSLTSQENLDLEHSRDLTSNYRYSYNLRKSGPVDSDSHEAGALVRHQLYESLTSIFDVHGSTLSSSSSGTTFESTRYGVGVNESYTKRLSDEGRLNLGYDIRLDHERRETIGQILFVADESHTLTDGVFTFLSQPRVVNVSSVTDPANVPYTEGLDYILIPHGELTEIRRVIGGLIPNGGTVLVDYTAAALPPDEFSTLSQFAQVRLELFDRLIALYGTLNLVDNYGGKSLILQKITDKVVGVEFSRQWLRAGAEYEDFVSNLSPFQSKRLFQSFTFEPEENSTLSLDLGQSWTTFLDVDRTRQSYNFIGRYRTRLWSYLFYTAEGGLRLERGRDFDQDLATGRMTIDFAYGQLTVNVGYEYQDEKFLGELRERNYFFLRAKRTF
jgi:hypothetical protein